MKRILQGIAILIGIIVVLLGSLVVYIYIRSNNQLAKTYTVEPVTLELPTDEESIAEGQRIFISRGCSGCHTGDGGGDPTFIDNPGLGTIPAPNLTRGAGGYEYTAEDYIRAIQHGVSRDGHALLIMPSQDWQQMPEAELAPLVAYLMQLEPVDREMPDATYGIVGRALVAFNVLPFAAEVIDHENAGLLNMEAAPTVEYGAYLAKMCMSCHGENYAGAVQPDDTSVIAPNLTPHEDGLGTWSLEDFMTALRTGMRPDGTAINPDTMPWGNFAALNDTEIEAIYVFLQSLEPVAGN